MRRWFDRLTLCSLALGVAVACDGSAAERRTWQPSDHSNTGGGGSQAPDTQRTRQSTGQDRPAVEGLDEVTIATWRTNCTVCHGTLGRADGPQSAIYQPRDLSDPAWQASVRDEELFAAIQQGKNKMPGFALPEGVAHNLVKLVRLFNAGRIGGGAHPPSAPGATSSAATSTAPTATSTAPTATSTPSNANRAPEDGAAGGAPSVLAPDPPSSGPR